ncbi:ABC transporter ATP-binding protein [Nitriliruptoraceae bacterium ZYF776]|nr:ABC transporter ATP-binding protein [Profundirhabdus halotolerans]
MSAREALSAVVDVGEPDAPPTDAAVTDVAATPVLAADRVSIRFGGLQALRDVSFSVHDNEIVGLIGPNGAGKTTFFNCVTGFYTPTEGEVYVHGQRVTDLRPDQRTALGIGRTFQHVGLVRSFTVLENLLVAQHRKVEYGVLAGLGAMPWTFDTERALRDRAYQLLDYLGLAELADEPLGGLSYGTLKQIEVAAVLATDPDVLMLDEPLAGLGPEESDAFGDRLLAMRRDLDLTVVIIEHHVPFMLRVCDYVYVLNFGQLLAEGKPEEVRGNRAVAEAYLGAGAVSLA